MFSNHLSSLTKLKLKLKIIFIFLEIPIHTHVIQLIMVIKKKVLINQSMLDTCIRIAFEIFDNKAFSFQFKMIRTKTKRNTYTGKNNFYIQPPGFSI